MRTWRAGFRAVGVAVTALAVGAAPASATIAYVANGTAYVANDDGTAAKQVLKGSYVTISRDARYVATLDLQHRARVHDRVTGAKRVIDLKDVVGVAWGNGGTLIASTNLGFRRTVRVYRINTEGLMQNIRTERTCNEDGCHGAFLIPSTSPAGDLVAVSGMLEFELAIQRTSGAKVCRVPGSQYQVLATEFSPDGRHLAVAENSTLGGRNRLVRVDTATCRRTVLTSVDHSAYVDSPVWSPDGARIAYTLNDFGTTIALRTIAATGGKPAKVTPFTAHEPTLSPVLAGWIDAGRVIYNHSGGVWIRGVAEQAERRVVRTRGHFDWAPTPPA